MGITCRPFWTSRSTVWHYDWWATEKRPNPGWRTDQAKASGHLVEDLLCYGSSGVLQTRVLGRNDFSGHCTRFPVIARRGRMACLAKSEDIHGVSIEHGQTLTGSI